MLHTGLHATSLHPGGIETNLGRHMPSEELQGFLTSHKDLLKSPAQGAATTIWAAVGREWADKGKLSRRDLQNLINFTYFPCTDEIMD